jgi:hypothetical protein
MKGRMTVENPDDVEVTLKLTMSLKEWAEVRDQLHSSYPSWCLSSIITSTLASVRNVHYGEKEFKSP